MRVAALYVDVQNGPYTAIANVDCWGVERDARTYGGPWPVVAHPPCKAWGRFRWRSSDDGLTAFSALESVRQYGGVLEHPAHSRFWHAAGLSRPNEFPDVCGGYTVEVRQCDWGHRCVKPTWLYIVGSRQLPEMPARRIYTPGSLPNLITIPRSQRHLTPPLFAAWLVEVARLCAIN